jgi:hypothetical protein
MVEGPDEIVNRLVGLFHRVVALAVEPMERCVLGEVRKCRIVLHRRVSGVCTSV